VGALGSRDRRGSSSFCGGESWLHLDIQTLTMQVQTRLPLVSSGPVSPEHWSRSHCQRMEQHAYLARFGRCAPTPLTSFAQGAWTAVANASRIDHPQTPILFSTVLMRDQDFVCWTPQGSIRLEGKVSSREAASFPGGGDSGGSIPRRGSRRSKGGWRHGLLGVLLREGRRKLGGAQRLRSKFVPQFESEVPGPLGHDLPDFLPPGRVTTPAIRLLLDVFVFQGRFKGTAMQVKRHDIRGGEGTLGEIGQEEFIDHAVADNSDLPFLFLFGWGGMGRHNDAHERSVFTQALIRAVIEHAADPAFWAGVSSRNCRMG
jgi:hypothetical protein